MQVDGCSFSRRGDGLQLRDTPPGHFWGESHEFAIDERTNISVGQLTASVYHWERGEMSGRFGQLHVPPTDDEDAASLAAHACIVTLGSEHDIYMNAILTPNLCMVRRSAAPHCPRTPAATDDDGLTQCPPEELPEDHRCHCGPLTSALTSADER